MSALTARYSLPKLLLLEAGCILFAVVGVLLATRSSATRTNIFWATLIILFFGLCGVVVAYRLLDRRTILIIDNQGIFDRRVSDRPIPWSAVTDIREYKFQLQRCCLIALSEPVNRFVDSRAKRLLLQMNSPWVGNGIFLSGALTVSIDQIEEAIWRFSGRPVTAWNNQI